MKDYPFPWKFDRSRYSDLYLLSRVPEDGKGGVKDACVAAIRALGLLAWPIDVGAKHLRGRAYGALKRAGMGDPSRLLRATHPGATDGVQGFPDVLGLYPNGRVLFIECKAPRWIVASTKTGKETILRREGLPTEEQLSFLSQAYEHEAIVGVAWSCGDAIKITKFGLRGVA